MGVLDRRIVGMHAELRERTDDGRNKPVDPTGLHGFPCGLPKARSYEILCDPVPTEFHRIHEHTNFHGTRLSRNFTENTNTRISVGRASHGISLKYQAQKTMAKCTESRNIELYKFVQETDYTNGRLRP
jgi:hypothetical protein